MSAVSDTILEALDLLEKHGWCTDQLEDSMGNMCARGAVRRATLGFANWTIREEVQGFLNSEESRAWQEAERVLYEAIPPDFDRSSWSNQPGSQVAYYNNSRESFDEIREWFERAAVMAGAEKAEIEL